MKLYTKKSYIHSQSIPFKYRSVKKKKYKKLGWGTADKKYLLNTFSIDITSIVFGEIKQEKIDKGYTKNKLNICIYPIIYTYTHDGHFILMVQKS